MEKCKEIISGEGKFGSFNRHQCSRKAVRDGYCNIHHPDSAKERQEKSQRAYEEKCILEKQNRKEYTLKALTDEELLDECKRRKLF